MGKRIKVGEKVIGYLTFGKRGQKRAIGIYRGYQPDGQQVIEITVTTRGGKRKKVKATATNIRRR